MDSSFDTESLDLSRKIPITQYKPSTPLSSIKPLTNFQGDSIVKLTPISLVNESKSQKSPNLRRRRISMQSKIKTLKRKTIMDSPKKRVLIIFLYDFKKEERGRLASSLES
jgi:hypothetical protein